MVRHIRRLPLGPAATRTSISSSARTGPSGAAASRVRAWSEMGTQFTIRTSACFRVANRSCTSSTCSIIQRSPFSSAAARSRAADITRTGTASRSRSIEPSRQLAPSTSSVSEEEVAHFDALASTWWDADRNTLIGMNPTRVSYIVQTLQTAGGRSTSHPPPTRPLHGLRALDVGCGGGLLSESLARLGADVTAVDPSIEVANAAREHSQHHPLTRRIDYRGGMSVEDLVRELTTVGADVADATIPAADADAHLFDLVCVLEVVEHATDPQSLLDGACQLLRPGGVAVRINLEPNGQVLRPGDCRCRAHYAHGTRRHAHVGEVPFTRRSRGLDNLIGGVKDGSCGHLWYGTEAAVCRYEVDVGSERHRRQLDRSVSQEKRRRGRAFLINYTCTTK